MSHDHPANVIHATDATLAEELAKPGIAFVDFWASWCGPCRILGPILDELASKNPDIRIIKVDVDANQQSAAKYQIFSIPTVYVFKDGQMLGEPIPGAQRPMIYDQILAMVRGVGQDNASPEEQKAA